MVVRPSTWMRDARTLAAATSRSVAPISMPTPDPKAISLRRSLVRELAPGIRSVAPRRIVPAQDVDRSVVSWRHILHLRGHGPLQVGKLAIVPFNLPRGPHRDDRVSAYAQGSLHA